MTLFYHTQAEPGASIELDVAEATHISRVLRLKDGDEIWVTNGRGLKISARLIIEHKRVVAVAGDQGEIMPKESNLTMAIAPTKNADRLEWFVEKAVEIGIEKIQLISCQHSERTSQKLDRLMRVAISALKQSQRFYLPEILSVMNFEDWLQSNQTEQRFIAHCRADIPRCLLQHAIKPRLAASLAIGPEGDFSKKEIESAMSAGFAGVSLGNARLRTETAALASVITFELMNQKTTVAHA
jgi:16S rRNA (uracil1498-N3)-methyltransferase